MPFFGMEHITVIPSQVRLTKFLPGRFDVIPQCSLQNIANNTFFHLERNSGYPTRNFAQKVIAAWRGRVIIDWKEKYSDSIVGFETLVELPRSGECYRRDGWKEVGTTKGYTCKRVAGISTDSWSGKRVWDTENLRPKLVFVRV